MTQAMQNQLKILLKGPVATLNGRVLADLMVNGLVARGLAEPASRQGRPVVQITNRGRLVMKRLDVRA